jgi:glyoxylase-like metal-dependent hydrolase (beta-lactamase superfamily II)
MQVHRRLRAAVVGTIAGAVLVTGCRSAARGSAAANTYEVSAVKYATLASFPVAGLVAGADTSRRMDIAMMVWLLRDQTSGRVVLVDAGFYRDKFIQRWKPVNYVKPSDALAAMGVSPNQVTDIIVSHVHWDHMDGLDLFPGARIWIQAEEYSYYVNPDGSPRNNGIDADDAAMLARLRERGRVQLVQGDAKEILPGITVYLGGRHTFASQYATVRTNGGTAVIASDNLYLYENLESRAPIAQTLDAGSNLRAQERMRTLASDARLIVPGHDPAVFTRFPSGRIQ